MRFSLALLLLINLFNYIDRYVLSAVEVLVRKELFAKPEELGGGEHENAKFWMGMLAPAFLVTYMITAPIFGWLGDRHRRWLIVALGVALWSLATGGTGLATTFAMLFVLRIFVGIGEAAWGPIAPTIIADMYPASKRGWVLSWFYIAIPVGAALGVILGGLIASWKSWHWSFFLMLPPGIVLAVLAYFRPEPQRGLNDQPSSSHARQPFLKTVMALKSNRSFVLNTLGMTAMTFAVGGMSFWMPTYVHEYRMGGLTDAAGTAQLATISTIFGGITVVAGLSGTLTGGWISDRLRGRVKGAYAAVAGVGMLLSFPCFLAVLYTPFPLAWVFMFLAIFGLMLNTGPTNTIIANVTPAPVRATAYAINILTIHALGDAISPPLIGLIAGKAAGGMNTAFLLVGVAIVVSGIIWIVAARWLDEDTRRIVASNA
ncbi:MAG: MFS transporter [Planctomycetota bacterium]|nr:MFS transporter [Planctomycetota bacterium]